MNCWLMSTLRIGRICHINAEFRVQNAKWYAASGIVNCTLRCMNCYLFDNMNWFLKNHELLTYVNIKDRTDMPFGIRPFLVAERQHIEFQRNISSAKHISSNFNCISSFASAKHIENPKDLYKNSSSEAVCDTSVAI